MPSDMIIKFPDKRTREAFAQWLRLVGAESFHAFYSGVEDSDPVWFDFSHGSAHLRSDFIVVSKQEDT